MTYQPYPTGGGAQNQVQPPQAQEQPATLRNAVRLMWAGAGLALLGAIFTLAFSGKIRTAVRKAALKANATNVSKGKAPLTAAQIHTLENGIVVLFAVVLIIGLLLWVAMAWANNKGSNWARIVATVLFALNTIYLILAAGRASLTIIFVGLSWLVGLVAIVLLWRKDTTAYIESRNAAAGRG
jgi:hypothetical protein